MQRQKCFMLCAITCAGSASAMEDPPLGEKRKFSAKIFRRFYSDLEDFFF